MRREGQGREETKEEGTDCRSRDDSADPPVKGPGMRHTEGKGRPRAVRLFRRLSIVLPSGKSKVRESTKLKGMVQYRISLVLPKPEVTTETGHSWRRVPGCMDPWPPELSQATHRVTDPQCPQGRCTPCWDSLDVGRMALALEDKFNLM